MACNTTKGVKMLQGSVEYLYADIRTNHVLETQPVMMSISPVDAPVNWITAEWVGRPAKFRSARILLNGSLAAGSYWVYARIIDGAETPIFYVGRLIIE